MSTRPKIFSPRYPAENQHKAAPHQGTGRLRIALAAFLAAMTVFRYCYILHGYLNLSPDEAHYWEWSRHLAIGYYSKGPVIAWLIRAGTILFGNTELGVRLLAPVLYLLGSLLIYSLGKGLFDEKTGVFAAALYQAVPLFSAFGVIMTIDAPATFFWILSLWLFWRAVSAQKGKAASWMWLGAAVGAGMLTKLTMSFFILSVFLYLISSPEGRRELRSVRPWLALIVCAVFLVPLVYWNSRHNWVNFRHESGHLNWAAGIHVSAGSFLQFLGSQLGVITPVLFVLIIYALIKAKKEKDEAGRFCFWFAVPTLVFFSLKSVFLGKVEANWAMLAYITGLIAAAPLMLRGLFGPKARPGGRFLMSLAPALAVFVTVVSYYPPIIGLPPRLDPSARLRGWRQLAAAVEEAAPPRPYFVFSDYYGVSSELAFYLKGNPAAYCYDAGQRMNQYDLWPGFEGFKRQNAVFVRIGSADMPRAAGDAFESYSKKTLIETERGKRLSVYTIFTCYGFRGMREKPAKTF